MLNTYEQIKKQTHERNDKMNRSFSRTTNDITSNTKENVMQVQCPKCGNQAYLENYGRVTGTVVGAAAGAAGTTAGGALGAKAGAVVGTCFGPLGIGIGAGVGALIGVLTASATGAGAGHAIGKLIDENMIGKYHCPHCDHTFSL